MAEPLPRTAAALAAGIDAGHHLGGQLYVSRRGEPVAHAAFGEVRPGEPMRLDHLLLWLSSTKPVAAVAIAQLWERGLLELDDPVARFVPEFAAHGKESITVRHLLTHTSGIRMLKIGWPEASWEEIIATIAATRPEPRWRDGGWAGYHRASSWFLLGELVRRLDGRRFETYVREEIFAPLEMRDAWVGMPVERYRDYGERIAPLFDCERTPPDAHDWHQEKYVTRCQPGGNGYGPMRDLGRFYESLLAGGRTPSGGPLLRPQTVEALTARHRAGLMDRTFRRVLDWGLGFILNSHRAGGEPLPYGYGPHASARAFGHSGYRSSLGMADPEHGLVVALAVNGTVSDEEHTARAHRLAAAIYEDLGIAREPAASR